MVVPDHSIDSVDSSPNSPRREAHSTHGNRRGEVNSLPEHSETQDSGISSLNTSSHRPGRLDNFVEQDGGYSLGYYSAADALPECYPSNRASIVRKNKQVSEKIDTSLRTDHVSLRTDHTSLHTDHIQVSPTPERKVITLHEASVMKIELLIVSQDKDGDNEILLAAMKGIEIYVILLIKCLVERKCPKYLNLSNDLGQSILYLTVYHNMLRATTLLVEIEEVELDTRDNNGNTPLHLACQKGFLSQVRALTMELKKPQNTVKRQHSELTELESERRARQKSRSSGRELAELLNYKGWNSLHVAVQNGHIDIANYLIKELKMNPNTPGGSRGMTLCHIAVENDDVPMLIYLIRHPKVDVNIMTYDKWAAVQFATFKQLDHIVNLLVTFNAHVGDVKYCQTLLANQASAQDDDDDDDEEDDDGS